MLDQLALALQLALEPLGYLLHPEKRIYWPYLLSAAIIGVAVIYWRCGN